MRTIEFLRDPALREIYLFAIAAAFPVVISCGVLSVLVVVKRLGFVGQGVSHSAFGGIGVAAVLAAAGLVPAVEPWGPVAQFAVVVAFCIAAALGMSVASNRRTVPVDTAIGLFLVASMALGAVLVPVARKIAESRDIPGVVQSWESILFGSVVGAGAADVILSALISALVVLGAWWWRRSLLFWSLDEDTAKAFGVPVRFIKTLLMALLALCVVISMKLAGVILGTALLVIPGAIALKLTDRFWPAIFCSWTAGAVGLLGGMVLSIETDWQAGPSIVLVLCTIFFASAAYARFRG